MPNLLLGILASSVQSDYAPPTPLGVAGYFTQGGNLGDLFRTTFPTDSWSDIGSMPGDGDAAGSGLQDAGVSGYVSQGFDTVDASDQLFKITFPTESISTTTSGLTTMAAGMGISNNGVAGYVGEGEDGFSDSSFVNRFAFPTDSVSAGPTLTSFGEPMTNAENGGASHHGILGHFIARTGPFSSQELGELQYPTETTTSQLLAPLAGGYFANAMWHDDGIASYYTQGFSFSPMPSPSDFVFKYVLAVFATSEIAPLPDPTAFNAGMSNDGVAGYVAKGGPVQFGGETDDVFKLAYSTDTWSVTASLPDDAGENAGFANMG